MKLRLLPIFLLLTSNLYSQELMDFLQMVEEGNRGLISAARLTEAENLHAKTGLWPDNPEIEYGYFPASGSQPGRKEAYSISQSFDFPTSYSTRNKRSDVLVLKNEYNFLSYRQTLLRDAAVKYYHFVFLQKERDEYLIRLNNTRQLYESYKLRFEKGDLSILDYNKSKLQYLSLKNEILTIEREIEILEKELALLTGNENFKAVNPEYNKELLLPLDSIVNATIENEPEINAHNAEIRSSELSLKLSRQNWLPNFNVAYESETETVQYRGLRAGISIPLWADKNTVSLSKAELAWSESKYEEMINRLKSNVERLHSKAVNLQIVLREYEEILSSTSNTEYLQKALDHGQISLIEYFTELSLYYSVMDKYLSTEREYYIVLLDLYKYRF
jgi:outer membrane protein TolC